VRVVLGCLDGRREGDDSVDVVAALELVDAPAARDVPGHGLADVSVEVGVAGVLQPPLDDRGVQPLPRGPDAGVGLRQRGDRDAALGQLERRPSSSSRVAGWEAAGPPPGNVTCPYVWPVHR